VIWPNSGFEADYDKIELQNIVMTSFQWRHHHYVTKKRHQNKVTKFFLIWVKISGYAGGLELIIWWSVKKRSWSWKSGLGLGLTGLDLGLEKEVLVLKKIGGLGL